MSGLGVPLCAMRTAGDMAVSKPGNAHELALTAACTHWPYCCGYISEVFYFLEVEDLAGPNTQCTISPASFKMEFGDHLHQNHLGTP